MIANMQSFRGMRSVIDTDMFVAGLLGTGAANAVIGACLDGRLQPLMGVALFAEYEDVLRRDRLFGASRLSAREREELFDIFLGACVWTHIYYGWRPNLADEADNHLIELAVAGTAEVIVTRNVRDLRRAELRFPGLDVITPVQCLRRM